MTPKASFEAVPLLVLAVQQADGTETSLSVPPGCIASGQVGAGVEDVPWAAFVSNRINSYCCDKNITFPENVVHSFK